MSINVSENKITITACFGAGSVLGYMDPKVNMKVQEGSLGSEYVVAIHSGVPSYQVGLSFTKGGAEKRRQYPYFLYTTYAEATGNWSFPTGDGSHVPGHDTGMLANGSPVAIGSGMVYEGGDSEPHAFNRNPTSLV